MTDCPDVSAVGAKRLCPECGLDLPPSGGCPHCLLQLALDGEDEPSDSPARRPPSGLQSRFFGGYEILDEISRGGMGVVYRARHLELKREVALKMIQSSQLLSPEARLRFSMEVAAVAQLNHPHIVALYESGEFKGTHFFTMRLVEGGTLAQQIKAARPGVVSAPKSPTPPMGSLATVASLLIKIAHAVHHAHQRGILHRDLKPSNILLDAQGEPHVADFGLAKLLAHESAATFTDSVLGSPNYMAPEQAAGQASELTTATDVYGLGAILYEALTGTPPFQAATPIETIRKVLDEEPLAPRKLKAGLDTDLETICLKCLQKNPAARYHTAEELADDLERWQKGLAIRARPVGPLGSAWRWSRRHPGLAVLGGALVATLVAIAVVASLAAVRIGHAERLAESRLRQALLEQVRVAQLSQEMGNRAEALRLLGQAVAPAEGFSLPANETFRARARDELLTALARTDLRFFPWPNWRGSPDPLLSLLAPDGNRVASVRDTTNVVLLGIEDGREQLRFSPGPAAIRLLERFSPDGRFLAMRHANGLDVWDLERNQRAFATNDSSSAIAFLTRPGCMLLGEGPEQNNLRVLTGLQETQRVIGFGPQLKGRSGWKQLAVSQDDRFVAVVREGDAIVTILALNDGRTVCRLTNTAPVNAIAWKADNSLLACAVSDGRVIVWNARRARRIVNLPPAQQPAIAVAFPPTGHLLAAAFEGRILRVVDLDGIRVVFETPCDARLASFAATGNRFGPVFRGNEPGWLEITEPAEFHQFTVGTTWQELLACRFTADSRFVMLRSGDFVDFLDPSNGGKPPGLSRVTAGAFAVDPRGETLLACSASSLLRWSKVEGQSAGFELTPLTGLPQHDWQDLAFSADGETLAAAHAARGVAVLLDRNLSITHAEFGPHPGVNAVALSPEQRWLASGSSEDRQIKIWDITTASNVITFAGGTAPRPLFSGDGRWLAVSGDVFGLRDTRSWNPAPPLPLPEGRPVTGAVAFSADSRWLALVCDLTTVQLFDLTTFQRLGMLRPPGNIRIQALAFSPDGHWLVAVGGNGRVRAWDIPLVRERLAEFQLDWDSPRLGAAPSH